MRYINMDFTTTTSDFDLMQDVKFRERLLEQGIDLTINKTMRGSLIVVVKAKTRIKFNDSQYYYDFIGDKVYVSGDASNFSKIIIEGNNISGMVSFLIG